MTSALALILNGSENNNVAKSDKTEMHIINGAGSLNSSSFMNYNRSEKNEYIEGVLSKGSVDIFNNSSFIRIEGTIEIISDSVKPKVTKTSGQASILNTIKATKRGYYIIAYTMSYSGDVTRQISFLRKNIESDISVNKFSSNTDDPRQTEQGILVGEVPVGEHIMKISSDVDGVNSFSKIVFSVIIHEK